MLQPYALTDMESARDACGVSDFSQDTKIERIVNAVSLHFANLCNRKFHYEEGIVERHVGRGEPQLFLRRAPLASITSVVVRGTEVASTDYTIESAENGRLYLSGGWWSTQAWAPTISAIGVKGAEAADIVITYDGGWITPRQAELDNTLSRDLPDQLEDLALREIAARYHSRAGSGIKSEGFMGANVTYVTGQEAGSLLSGVDDELMQWWLP